MNQLTLQYGILALDLIQRRNYSSNLNGIDVQHKEIEIVSLAISFVTIIIGLSSTRLKKMGGYNTTSLHTLKFVFRGAVDIIPRKDKISFFPPYL